MLSIEKVNKLNYTEFRDKFGSVIEYSPFVAAGVWSARPFSNREALHTATVSFLSTLHREAKLGVLRCYPDLAGRLSEANQLSDESTKEHQSAGLLSLTEEEKKSLGTLNEAYKSKFQFPFVLCARENKKEAIFREIKKRLNSEPNEEVEIGIGEVGKIAFYRIADLVEGSSNL